MTFELDGLRSSWCPCQKLKHIDMPPLNHCDMKTCSDGISIIATALIMYQVDYNKLIVPPKSRQYIT